MKVKEDIDKIIKEHGDNLNFTLVYFFEVKVRDGKPVSVLLNKEVSNLKIVYKVSPDFGKEGSYGYDDGLSK